MTDVFLIRLNNFFAKFIGKFDSNRFLNIRNV